jgi:hypothetical protein
LQGLENKIIFLNFDFQGLRNFKKFGSYFLMVVKFFISKFLATLTNFLKVPNPGNSLKSYKLRGREKKEVKDLGQMCLRVKMGTCECINN